MKIFIYRPARHLSPQPVLKEVANRVDALTIEVLEPLAGERIAREGWNYEVLRDLPRLRVREPWRMGWLSERVRTSVRRCRLRRLAVQAIGSDIVHIDHLNYFLDGVDLRLLRKSGRRIVGWAHDVEPHVPRLPMPMTRWLLRRQYSALDRILVAHDQLRSMLINRYSVSPARVESIPFPIVPVDCEPGMASSCRRSILFFGSLRKNKGIEVLLQTFRALEDPRLRLIIAGTGDPTLKSTVARVAKEDRRIKPELKRVTNERKEELFRSAGIVVLPYTTFSSQSGVLRDAYCAGTPLVVSDVGAIGLSVQSDGSGLVVPPSDPRALGDAIVRLIEDEALWRSCRRAIRRIQSERTLSNTADLFLAAYQRALEAPSVGKRLRRYVS